MNFVVAIDGPAAAGKGTISKAIAKHFGFSYLDTGLLYRAVGKKALAYSRTSYFPEVAEQLAKELTKGDLSSDDLRTPEIAKAASKIAIIPNVREALLEFQRNFAREEGMAVLDGRDIGTVVWPEADVKLFVTASAEVRAERRFLELCNKGQDVERQQVLLDVIERDKRDEERSSAPLKMAADAIEIDTSDLSIQEAINLSTEIIQNKITQLKRQ